MSAFRREIEEYQAGLAGEARGALSGKESQIRGSQELLQAKEASETATAGAKFMAKMGAQGQKFIAGEAIGGSGAVLAPQALKALKAGAMYRSRTLGGASRWRTLNAQRYNKANNVPEDQQGDLPSESGELNPADRAVMRGRDAFEKFRTQKLPKAGGDRPSGETPEDDDAPFETEEGTEMRPVSEWSSGSGMRDPAPEPSAEPATSEPPSFSRPDRVPLESKGDVLARRSALKQRFEDLPEDSQGSLRASGATRATYTEKPSVENTQTLSDKLDSLEPKIQAEEAKATAQEGQDLKSEETQEAGAEGEAETSMEDLAPELSEASSAWGAVGGILGDLIPFVGAGLGIYTLIEAGEHADEAGKEIGADPYASVRGKINQAQQKMKSMNNTISADQFASKIGAGAVPVGSLAIPTVDTSRQMMGGGSHF